MFFACELKKLRRLKSALLAQYRCEKILANLSKELEPRIDACEELAELKLAEENLEVQKNIDIEDKKKSVRRVTWIVGIIALLASATISLLLSLTLIPTALIIVVGTFIPTLIANLIAKSVIKKKPAKNADEIAACEEEYAIAMVAFEAAKIIIEDQLQVEIAYYENILKILGSMIQMNTVVPDSDKNYNTVCQIIWCLEHKYAFSVKGARQWVTLANFKKQVRAKIAESSQTPQEEETILADETEEINSFEKILNEVEGAE